MRRADVKVWFACNNHCDFCVQGNKREIYKPRTKEEICAILDEEFSNGCWEVVFTGGEPTVHPKLIECIEYASKIGYSSIQVQSNGRRFADMEYLQKIVQAGVTEFSPSIHGFKKETHDMLVHSPGAWEEVIRGIINIRKLGFPILINSVITRQNYKEAPELASLLVKLWVSSFQFAFVHILGTAALKSELVVPKKTEILPYIKKALDIGRANNVTCMTEAIPFCLMQGYEWAIAEYNFMPDTTVVDAEYRTESYADYRWNQWKAKREECMQCKKNAICEWPWKEYPEIYGWEEFKPL